MVKTNIENTVNRRKRIQILWMIRFMALGHYTWGAALLLLAAWFAISALRVLPYMSTGTIWTNLPTSLIMAASQAAPLTALGLWFMVLGHRAWTGHVGLRKALITTHGILLLPGLFVAAVGVFALRAGARSAAQGGGLLSPIGMFPLAIGAGAVVLALISIMLALTVVPRLRHLK
jgi:hypothetical protein